MSEQEHPVEFADPQLAAFNALGQAISLQTENARLRSALERNRWQDNVDETQAPSGGRHCVECGAYEPPKGGTERHDVGCLIATALGKEQAGREAGRR